jgi:AcrR family transcriptional regulator
MPRRSQAERTQATRAALITSARRLFAEHGYAQVSAEQIVAAGGLTRGALYHHFTDKHDLFQAVFEQVEQEITDEIAQVIAGAPDSATANPIALGRFLDLCERPDVLRIALTDAPAVLGWSAWREIEARHGLGLLTEALQHAGEESMLPAPAAVLAQLVLGAVIEAALLIAHAPDRSAARRQCEQGLLVLLGGLIPTGSGTGAPPVQANQPANGRKGPI